MATLSPRGRIDVECVDAEIVRLKRLWANSSDGSSEVLDALLGADALAESDPFDRLRKYLARFGRDGNAVTLS